MDVSQIVFNIFACGLIISAIVVVSSSFPVRSALALVSAFICSAVLWIMQGAEFLGLALIFVYVGAVMTLFLFVVMMLGNNLAMQDNKVNWLQLFLGMIFALGLFAVVYSKGLPQQIADSNLSQVIESNSNMIGTVLYTKYIFEFELAAFILLVGMIAAIALTFRGKQSGNKAVKVEQQLEVSAKTRLHYAKFDKE